MLAGFAAIPIAAALSASATATPPAVSTSFAAAVDLFREALAAERAFDAVYMKEASEAFERAVAAIPHVKTDHGYRTYDGRVLYPSTSDLEIVAAARRTLRGIKAVTIEEDYYLTYRELVAAADDRGAQIDALPENAALDAVIDRSDEFCEARCKARETLLAMPVASAAELAIKLDIATEEGLFGDILERTDDVVALIRADLGRLAAGGLH
jgi:hypothetical protein